MKVHDGNCVAHPCSRTHAYKCRACQTWFRQEPVEMGGAQLRPHPFYPYCSHACAILAQMVDKGYHMFQQYVNIATNSKEWELAYPDATIHNDFNNLITQTKEL